MASLSYYCFGVKATISHFITQQQFSRDQMHGGNNIEVHSYVGDTGIKEGVSRN